MFNFWSFFTRRSRFSIILIIAITFLGIGSILSIPKESSPKVTVPIAVITTVLPGASPEDVEKLVTNVLEEPLKNNLDDLKDITSISRDGVSSITVEFQARADMVKSMRSVRDEVATAKVDLPKEANDPKIVEIDFGGDPVVTATLSTKIPPEILYRLGKETEKSLEKVRGVSSVVVGGIAKREVSVIINRKVLLQYGITVTDVVRAIAGANITLPVGSIQMGDIDFPVRLSGNIRSAEDVANIPILSVGGTPIYVRDVAKVINGRTKPKTISRTSYAGGPSVTSVSFNIFKSSGAKITEVSNVVNAKFKKLTAKGGLLEGMNITAIYDNGKLLQDDLTTLSRSGIQTVALVTLVLLIAVGWREAFIAAISIPLSFLVAFIGLKYSGNTLNFVSLFALILSIGIIVDSTIVIVEGINRRLRELDERSEEESKSDRQNIKSKASLDVVREFHIPLTTGTLTTVAVFAPLMLVSGITGEFIKSIPLTIIFVLLASLLVALGFVPLFATKLLHRGSLGSSPTDSLSGSASKLAASKLAHSSSRAITMAVNGGILASLKQKMQKFAKARNSFVETSERKYRNYLAQLLKNRESQNVFLVTLIALFLISMALPAIGAVRTVFFESSNSDYIFIQATLPTGTVLARTDLEIRKAEEILYSIPEVTSFVTTVGRSSVFSNPFGGSSASPRIANIFVDLDKKRSRVTSDIVDEIRKKLNKIHTSKMSVEQLSDGPPSLAPVTITVYGDDFSNLEKTANTVKNILQEIPGTTDVNSSVQNSTNEFVLKINRAKVVSQGTSIGAIAESLRSSLYGNDVTEIKQIGDNIKIVARVELNTKSDAAKNVFTTNSTTINTLTQIEVATKNGPVPLSTFVTVKVAPSRSSISHKKGIRVALISSRLVKGGNAMQITKEFKKRISKLSLPNGVSISIGGESKDIDQSFKDMFVALIIGVISMFAILVLQFNSFRYAMYVLAIVPLSLIGVFAGLMITRSPLSFPSIMGFIALSGIVVNNAIILIDAINNNRRKYGTTKTINEIVVEASASRLRPVLLTALTTVVGMVPLLFAAAIWTPLAYALMFGLSFATIITLILVPSIYARWPGKFDN